MNPIFSMLLSSNILILFFFVIEHFKTDLFSQRNKYAILKIALFFSIIPLSSIKFLLVTGLHYFFPATNTLDFSLSGKLPAIMITPTGYHINTAYRNNLLFLLIWFFIAFLLFTTNLRKQCIFKRNILKTTQESLTPTALYLIEKYKKLLKINKRVHLFVTQLKISPFTIGVFKPIIVMPDITDINKQELIIHHELCHIKKHDNAIKFLQAIVVGLFWFNPLIYLLNSCLNIYCEFACDELVIQELDKTGRKNYAHLIVDLATYYDSFPNPHTSSFSNNKNDIKKRINYIMKNKKNSKFTVMIAFLIIVSSSFPTLASQDPTVIIWEQTTSKDLFPQDSTQYVTFKSNEYNISEPNYFTYESQFIDKDGNVYEQTFPENETKKNCQHTFVDGEYSKHIKNKNGSCITKTWSAKRCSKCSTLNQRSLISKLKYIKCPH